MGFPAVEAKLSGMGWPEDPTLVLGAPALASYALSWKTASLGVDRIVSYSLVPQGELSERVYSEVKLGFVRVHDNAVDRSMLENVCFNLCCLIDGWEFDSYARERARRVGREVLTLCNLRAGFEALGLVGPQDHFPDVYVSGPSKHSDHIETASRRFRFFVDNLGFRGLE